MVDWDVFHDDLEDAVHDLQDDVQDAMSKDDSAFIQETIDNADGDLPGIDALEGDDNGD